MPYDWEWPAPHFTATPSLHQAFNSVAADLDDRTTIVFGWEMPSGEWAGLTAQVPADPAIPAGEHETDLSDTTEWRRLLDRAIEVIAASWGENDAGMPDTVWAIRLGLSGGRHVVVALGEVRAGTVKYQPDNIVVSSTRRRRARIDRSPRRRAHSAP
jgi:hypothetical protein